MAGYDDITKYGVNGLRGLPSIERQAVLSKRLSRTSRDVHEQFRSPAEQDVGVALGQLGVGASKYDKEIYDIDQAFDLNETRANVQPWYDQLANGGLKMLTTAATTFLDGTLGTLVGIGTGIYNRFDNDPNTGFWRGMWDNSISNAMAEINNEMEEHFANYMTEWEQNATIFQRMFSGAGAANFWGNDILKNAGFTIGAAAAIYATAGVGSALKGVSMLGKVGKGLGLLKAGQEGLELTKAGKAASWIAKTFVSTQGEAAIEAVNSMRENREAMELNIENRKKQLLNSAKEKYDNAIANGENPQLAEAAYRQDLTNISKDIAATKNQMEAELQDAGNNIYAANIAALSISNNLTLGSLIKGGYGTATSLLRQATMTAGGKPIEGVRDAAKAMLKGNLKFEVDAIKNGTPKVLGKWALQSAQEGLEEGVQNLASNTGNIVAQARLNKWVKDNTMLGTMINPDAEETLSQYHKALTTAYEDQFGAANSPGWTEVAAGFISGMLGVPGMHRKENGKLGLTWNGGFMEAREEIYGKQKAIQKQADLMNKALTDGKFQDRLKHAVQQIAIKQGQDAALENQDELAFDNYDLQKIVSDALFFKRMGMLDEYKEMYTAFAEGLTDDDVQELKAATKDDKGASVPFDGMEDEKIKEIYKNSAEKWLARVNSALDKHEEVRKNWESKFPSRVRDEAIQELTFRELLYENNIAKIAELEREIMDLENKENPSTNDAILLTLKRNILEKIKKQNEESKEETDEWKADPKLLEAEIEKRMTARQKRATYADAKAAINKYKEARTIKDVIDIFNYSPEESREKVLESAIKQAKGDTKDLLVSFRNFMGDYNTISSFIEDTFKDNPQKSRLLGDLLDSFIEEIINDDSPVTDRATLKQKFEDYIGDIQGKLDTSLEEAKGIDASSEEALNESINRLLAEGIFDESNLVELLDDDGNPYTDIAEDSELDAAIDAAQNAETYKEHLEDLNKILDTFDKLDDLRATQKQVKTQEGKKKQGAKKKKTKQQSKKGANGSTFSEEEVANGDDDENLEELNEEDGEDNGEESPEEDEAGEEIVPPQRTPIDVLLTSKEQRYYKIKEEVGASGMVYYRVQRKQKNIEPPADVKKSVGKKMRVLRDTLTVVANNITKSSAKEDIEKLIKLIQNSVINGSDIALFESLFEKYAAYLKPATAKRPSRPSHSDAKGQNSDPSRASINGTQHPNFVKSELTENKRQVEVTYQSNGETPLQVWARDNGFNIQDIVDTYLGDIIKRDSSKDVSDRTKVYYLTHEDRPKDIFIAVEYADVEDIIPRDAVKLVEGKYVLIGTIGWYSGNAEDTPIIQPMVENIAENMDSLRNSDSGEWVIDTEHTNRLKSITAGSTVRITLKDDNAKIRTIRELLDKRNPKNLTEDSLGWIIVKGDEDKIIFEEINADDKDHYLLDSSSVLPGQVYMLIPGNNNMYIPVMMEAVYLDQILEVSEIMDTIQSIIDSIMDENASYDERKEAMKQLRQQLIFSPQNNIHLNGEEYKKAPNTIYITRDGEPVEIINFNSGEGTAEDLLNAILSINPRINISASVLERSPEIYIDNDVLRTDIALLGTVNSQITIYPIDDNLEYVENKPRLSNTTVSDGSVKRKLYLNGKHYYTDGSVFYDESGEIADDPDDILKILYDIKQEEHKKDEDKNYPPIMWGTGKKKFRYYDINGVIYADNGHGGFNEVTEELADKIRSVGKKGKNDKNKKKRAKKVAQNIRNSETVIIKNNDDDDEDLDDLKGDSDEQGGEDDDDENLDDLKPEEPEEPAEDESTPSNFANGRRIDRVKSKEELEAGTDSSTLKTALKDRANKAKKKEIIAILKTKGQLQNTDDPSLGDIIKALTDMSIDVTSGDLDTIIQTLKTCRE